MLQGKVSSAYLVKLKFLNQFWEEIRLTYVHVQFYDFKLTEHTEVTP